jgi:hypothetical protein
MGSDIFDFQSLHCDIKLILGNLENDEFEILAILVKA